MSSYKIVITHSFHTGTQVSHRYQGNEAIEQIIEIGSHFLTVLLNSNHELMEKTILFVSASLLFVLWLACICLYRIIKSIKQIPNRSAYFFLNSSNSFISKNSFNLKIIIPSSVGSKLFTGFPGMLYMNPNKE